MRVRTAVTIVTAFVVVKGALTAIALTAWAIISERRWPVDHWHIELGPLTEWLAGIAAAGAAIVALWIATRDRWERRRERDAADEAQANLVLVEVFPSQGFAGFDVRVTNYGSRAVLNVEFETAQFEPFPNAEPVLGERARRRIPVVDCDREPGGFWFGFVEDGSSVITGHTDSHGNWVSDNADATKVAAYVRFKDADGNRWRRSNRSDTERLRNG
jgi:hypothetical protein